MIYVLIIISDDVTVRAVFNVCYSQRRVYGLVLITKATFRGETNYEKPITESQKLLASRRCCVNWFSVPGHRRPAAGYRIVPY